MISIKRQTKRVTKWLPDFADNINIFYNKGKYKEYEFQFALVTSKNWGNFLKINVDDPSVQLTIDNKHYEMKLSEFKKIIKKAMK